MIRFQKSLFIDGIPIHFIPISWKTSGMSLKSDILDVEMLEKEWVQIWLTVEIIMVQEHDKNLSRDARSINNPKKLIITRLWVNQPVR